MRAYNAPIFLDPCNSGGASSSGQGNDGDIVAVFGTVPLMEPAGHGVDPETDPVEVLLGVGGEGGFEQWTVYAGLLGLIVTSHRDRSSM